ncbi:MAG: SPFH domain-containing protein [Erysipelotrichales bacterium]|nr:SPFH domain-containing protein [Erysipelotrichales bacterium]
MGENNLDIIKYVGDNRTLVWKHHIENFNSNSQLIVNESQEAIFYKDGQALDLFGKGIHSLKTENLPFLKRVFGKIFGDKTPFTCDVVFVNKVSVLDILWGTDTPLPVEDPKYHLIVNVRSYGQMGISVADSRRFVVRVVGQLPSFDVDSVKKTIKGLIITYVREEIHKAIVNMQVSILEINTRITEMSRVIEERLNAELEDLGLKVSHFYLNSVSCGEDDLAKLKEAKEKFLTAMNDIEIERLKTIKMGEAMAQARAVQGYTYQDERKFDVLENAAKNESAGSTMNPMMGLGMGLGIGKGMQDSVSQMSTSLNAQNADKVCPQCHAMVKNGAKFCPECGYKMFSDKITCPHCGVQVDANAKFCLECGNKLEPAKAVCPNCNEEVETGSKFCSKCGFKL